MRRCRRFEDLLRRETESWSINVRTEAGNNAKHALDILLELNAELKKRGVSDYRPNLVTLTWKYSGHTQVNATDLRRMKYPSRDALIQFGSR
jgi:hypothetical protein